jgi:hypothetical protein
VIECRVFENDQVTIKIPNNAYITLVSENSDYSFFNITAKYSNSLTVQDNNLVRCKDSGPTNPTTPQPIGTPSNN